MDPANVIRVFREIVKDKKNNSAEKKGELIQAIKSLSRAINHTEIYLTNSNRVYKPNYDLSDLWLDAFEKLIKVEPQLARKLHEKSRFWSNPEFWLNEPEAMKLVPTLKQLNDDCRILELKLK